MNIFEKDLAGMPLDGKSPEVAPIIEIIKATQRLVARLNSGEKSEEEVRELLAQITGRAIDPSLWLLPPFYTDFGAISTLAKMSLSIPPAPLWIEAGYISMMRCLSPLRLISSPLTTISIPLIATRLFASPYI